MANRLVHLKWQMDWDAFDTGLRSGGDFPAPQFDVLPHDWTLHLSAMGGQVAAFRKRNPGAFTPDTDAKGNMRMDRSRMSGPWPSPRSWFNGVRCMAAAKSVGAGRDVEAELLSGCVGPEVAGMFFSWQDEMDLPDPEDLLKKAMAVDDAKHIPYEHPDRSDKVMAMLSAIAGLAIQRKSADHWAGAIRVFERAAEHSRDLAIICMRPLIQQGNMPKGARINPKFVKEFMPMLEKTLL